MLQVDRDHAWDTTVVREWFAEFANGPEGIAAAQQAASDHDICGMWTDLRDDWFHAMATTLATLDNHHRPLPDWIRCSDTARRYALRRLHDRATDLDRRRQEHPESQASR